MVKASKYVVIERFKENPKRSDFKIVTYDLPPLQDHQILVKVGWISVDPYMRSLPGYQVGIVQEPKKTLNTQSAVGWYHTTDGATTA